MIPLFSNIFLILVLHIKGEIEASIPPPLIPNSINDSTFSVPDHGRVLMDISSPQFRYQVSYEGAITGHETGNRKMIIIEPFLLGYIINFSIVITVQTRLSCT